jgi:Tfp pilus assembly protein PilX
MKQRGSALVQVMIAAVVVAIICASVIRSRLQPALMTANAAQNVEKDAAEQGALNRVQQVWMAKGSCASDAAAGVSCTGAGCACVCSVANLGTVTAVPSGGACALTVTPP